MRNLIRILLGSIRFQYLLNADDVGIKVWSIFTHTDRPVWTKITFSPGVIIFWAMLHNSWAPYSPIEKYISQREKFRKKKIFLSQIDQSRPSYRLHYFDALQHQNTRSIGQVPQDLAMQSSVKGLLMQ